MSESTYIPGMCNINTAEVAYRRKAMWFGIAVSLVMFIGLIAFNSPWWLGALALFVPVYIAAIGHLQVRNKFCVSYGANGKQNADENSEAAVSVVEDAAIKADKTKSKRMNLQALAITAGTLAVTSLLLILV